jgi:hypothetical protein
MCLLGIRPINMYFLGLDFLRKRCPFPKHKSVVFGENWEGELPSGFTGPKYSKTDPDGCFSYHSMKV